MKYVVMPGWKDGSESHDYVIGICDTFDEAIGKAYNYLTYLIESGYGTLYCTDYPENMLKLATDEDGKKVFGSDIVSISIPYPLYEQSGYYIEIVERKHKDNNWNGSLDELLNNYVKIFSYNIDDPRHLRDKV